MPDIQLYDATLRDGMQGPGLTLSAAEKVRVARKLDELGVHLIEAGFPSSNPKELELFELLAQERFEHADVAAFGMTRRRGVPAAEDDGLRVLADCFAPVCTIVGKTWGLHLEKVVRVDRAENLAMIAESVAFLVQAGKRVVYDAEHFFDGYRDDPGYALDCLRAAAGAGAETVALCDTNGSSLPPQVAEATAAVLAAVGDRVRVAIHCHNDAECGVANTLAAVEVGARQVQGTMNGVGERTGNANLVSIIANLQLKMGRRVLADEQLAHLTEAAHFVDELLNRPPNRAQAYVGRDAFAHKGGLHVAGVRADSATFEHVDPALVGNTRELLVSELAGRHTVAERAAAAGLDFDDAAAQRVIDRVKLLEHGGYQFEAADGSFDLLLRRESGDYEPLFRLESWRVIVEQRADGKVETEATIKIWLDGERYIRTAEGNGPVNALDAALRDAIGEIHPHLKDIELVNYKVRILDEDHGTGATTRVLIDASDGRDVWGSIGVHENIIAASWEALVDSLAYAEQPGRRADGRAGDADGRGVTARADVGGPRRPGRAARADDHRGHPPRPARARARGGGRGHRGPALGPALAGAARAGLRAGLRGVARRRARVRGGERHGRAAPRPARRRGVRRRRGRHLALLVRGQRQRRALRARAPGLRRHRRAHAEPRSRRRGGRGDRAHGRAAARAHLRLPGRPAGLRAHGPADRRGRLRGAGRGARRRRARSARAGTRRPSASTPTSS